MHIHRACLFIPCFLSLPIFSVSQDTPSLCNRLYHSSIVVNNILYVDGGELRTVLNGAVSVTIPNTVDTIDLSKPFSNADTSIWSHIYKNSTSSTNNAPTLNDGCMFSDNSNLYLFGGAISLAPGAPAVPPPNGIWQYDLGKSAWSQSTPGGDPVQRIHIGQNAQSSSSAVGYYLGGVITPKSDPTFNALPSAVPYMVQGLVTFNEGAMKYTNSSTSGLDQDGTRAWGFTALVESFGAQGALISFGGITNDAGVPMQLGDSSLVDPSLHSSLGNISVYDIGSQTWYEQAATGDIPPWRYAGCSVVVSAPDQSSHSIYIFGGWGNTYADSDGHVFVLSIPSFRWIKVNQDSDRRQHNHCNLIGNHTMLVVGGIKPNSQNVQPSDASGCDASMFSQVRNFPSISSHTCTRSGMVTYAWESRI